MSRKRYAKKEKSSKSTYVNFFKKLMNSGKSLSVINHIPNTKKGVKSFNKLFGTHLTKISSLIGKKNLIKQIKNDINSVVSEYIEKQKITNNRLKTFLYNESYELLNIKEEDTKEIKKIETIVNEVKLQDIQKDGQYGVYKIVNLIDNHEYYIKYHDKESFQKRLNELKVQYKINNFFAKFLGVYMYKTYIEKEFKKRLQGYNLV